MISLGDCFISLDDTPNEILCPLGPSWSGKCPLAGCLEDGNGKLYFINVYI